MREATAQAGSVSMLVLDVDRLKLLNDTHGHSAGADAVRMVGHVIAELIPPAATACRYGGDEFAIALSGDRTQAWVLGEAILARVKQLAPILAGHAMPMGALSISVGVATQSYHSSDRMPGQGSDPLEVLFQEADRALYIAKGNGRGQTAVAN